MKKKVLRSIFWLALLSAASSHNIMLGLVLYPFAQKHFTKGVLVGSLKD